MVGKFLADRLQVALIALCILIVNSDIFTVDKAHRSQLIDQRFADRVQRRMLHNLNDADFFNSSFVVTASVFIRGASAYREQHYQQRD